MPKLHPEPWLRATHAEIPPVPRAAIHALELADEDLTLWCATLTNEELNTTPFGLPSLAFQLRHIARSVDRLLTYAEGKALSASQLEAVQSESSANCSWRELSEELARTWKSSFTRIQRLSETPSLLHQPRTVGRENLPTTVAGLLVHVADHTQRHVGQAITTAKILLAQRRGQSS
jgi:uncharacterized damage-inducible protein DinB